MQDVEAYVVGVMTASVCSRFSLEETARRLNEESPTGISSLWQPAENKEFATGQPNPCPCERSPETHKHYLFEC